MLENWKKGVIHHAKLIPRPQTYDTLLSRLIISKIQPHWLSTNQLLFTKVIQIHFTLLEISNKNFTQKPHWDQNLIRSGHYMGIPINAILTELSVDLIEISKTVRSLEWRTIPCPNWGVSYKSVLCATTYNYHHFLFVYIFFISVFKLFQCRTRDLERRTIFTWSWDRLALHCLRATLFRRRFRQRRLPLLWHQNWTRCHHLGSVDGRFGRNCPAGFVGVCALQTELQRLCGVWITTWTEEKRTNILSESKLPLKIDELISWILVNCGDQENAKRNVNLLQSTGVLEMISSNKQFYLSSF